MVAARCPSGYGRRAGERFPEADVLRGRRAWTGAIVTGMLAHCQPIEDRKAVGGDGTGGTERDSGFDGAAGHLGAGGEGPDPFSEDGADVTEALDRRTDEEGSPFLCEQSVERHGPHEGVH